MLSFSVLFHALGLFQSLRSLRIIFLDFLFLAFLRCFSSFWKILFLAPFGIYVYTCVPFSLPPSLSLAVTLIVFWNKCYRNRYTKDHRPPKETAVHKKKKTAEKRTLCHAMRFECDNKTIATNNNVKQSNKYSKQEISIYQVVFKLHPSDCVAFRMKSAQKMCATTNVPHELKCPMLSKAMGFYWIFSWDFIIFKRNSFPFDHYSVDSSNFDCG